MSARLGVTVLRQVARRSPVAQNVFKASGTRVAARRCLATEASPSSLKGLAIQTEDPLVVSPGGSSLGFEATAQEGQMQTESIGRPIYLDMQATTPVDPRVLDAMLPYMTNQYGNPHSKTHAYGWETEKAVEDARKHIADLVNANPKDIVFTSGATESNNMSIKGVARFYKGKKRHIITTQTEHKCVLDSCRVLQDEGFEVTYLPVQKNGIVDLELLEKSIRPDTVLVSVMMVNNEIGVIQPLKEIGAIVRKHKGVFFHTDAAQALGKIPIDVEECNIDLMSLSGHKIYGPKGVGACYVRRRPRVRLEPIMSGGGQERGLRSGTVPAPLAVGFGEACRLARTEMSELLDIVAKIGVSVSATRCALCRGNEVQNGSSPCLVRVKLTFGGKRDEEHVKRLSKKLYEGVTSQCESVVLNGDPNGYPGCLNLSFAFIEGESMLMAMKDIALSSGSACTSASLEPSYVLRALGTEEDMAHSSIRFGIGRFTTDEEVDFVTSKIVGIVQRLRDLSPLWEMHLEGVDLKSIDWSQH